VVRGSAAGEARRVLPRTSGDRVADRALRVSRYLEDEPVERHTRLSIWSASETNARAEAAVSLDEAETARLARFLIDTESAPEPPRGLRRILDQFLA
jgi:hypothetical protein